MQKPEQPNQLHVVTIQECRKLSKAPKRQFADAAAQAIQPIAPYMITTLKDYGKVGDKLLLLIVARFNML